MKICIFEDEKADQLYPLALTRAVFELRCGHTTLREKMMRLFPEAKVCYAVRDYLAASFKEKSGAKWVNDIKAVQGSDCLFLNGRWLALQKSFEIPKSEKAVFKGDQLVWLFAKKERIGQIAANSIGEVLNSLKEQLPREETSVILIEYPWDLIHHNPDALRFDFKMRSGRGIQGKIHEFVSIIGNRDDIFVAPDAEIQPFCVLDATNGPIYIEEGAILYPHSRVEGPSYIGRETSIYGANVREGCSLGPVSRVGGEIEESIFHGYSNKYHAGFIGHSYLGEWINLGAMTTNSDLKNDYSTVQVYMKGRLIDSGDTKVGLFMGDHTKTGLSSLFNTGTICGAMCIILPSGDLLPKFIPSFCWYFRGKFSKGRGFKSFIETARVAMSRRKKELTRTEIEMLQAAYELTKEERMAEIRKSRAQ